MSSPHRDTRINNASTPGNTEYRLLYVYARLPFEVHPENVYPEDWDAPGLYEVFVPAEFSDSFAANCALAGYNSRVPIKYLYMFEFCVRDPETGLEIEPDFSRDYYEFADRCGGVKLLGHLA